jgi:hypothetical protein
MTYAATTSVHEQAVRPSMCIENLTFLWCSDYRHMPELDQYEKEGIASDADVESLSENAAEEARQAAERELERRDKREAGELPMAFQSGALLLPLHLFTSPLQRSCDLIMCTLLSCLMLI